MRAAFFRGSEKSKPLVTLAPSIMQADSGERESQIYKGEKCGCLFVSVQHHRAGAGVSFVSLEQQSS